MNPLELFLIAQIFCLKIEKYHHFKPAYGKVCDFLKYLLIDFITIDVETHSMLNIHVDLPPLEDPIILVDGIRTWVVE